jgi:protein phosphatase
MGSMAQLHAVSMSQPGKNRRFNEDCFLDGGFVPDHFALETSGHGTVTHQSTTVVKQTACLAVFDGLGGQVPADAVAWMAADALKAEMTRLTLLPLTYVDALMQRTINRVHERICQIRQANQSQHDIGTTFSCLCVRSNQAVVYSFGRCRAYLYRQTMLKPQAVEPTQALSSAASQPARYLGMPDRDNPLVCETSGIIALENQDVFLLCSQSLTETLDDATIRSCLNLANPKDAAAQLMTLVRERGCQKSVTLTVARWLEEEPAPKSRTMEPGKLNHPRQPNPRIEHEHQVFKIPVEKAKVNREPIKFSHFDFWQHIPFWMQILNLIALLGLILFLIWLFNRGLFS